MWETDSNCLVHTKMTFCTLALLGLLNGFALATTAEAQKVWQFEIKDWPRNLRTDLKGSSITVALPENAPDRPWKADQQCHGLGSLLTSLPNLVSVDL
jgi:hypothetical protein